MFVCVARLTLEIPASGSLKAKRQVLRRVTDRIKAKFNVSVAEVDDNDLWQRATIALAVVGNDKRHVGEQMDKIIQFVDDMYIAPIVDRQTETIALGDQLYRTGDDELPVERGDRSLAEAEGQPAWERRHERPSENGATLRPEPSGRRAGRTLSLEEARAKARALRNPREWEKK